MGFAQVNGIQLYWEAAGEGTPLVLIEGLGYATWMWRHQIPAFSPHYQVIAFDNRGTGQSDKPESMYSVQLMADDTAGLLRELGIERAHILGVSLGGFIAQQLAVCHPELVDRLILWSTGFGGPNMVVMSAETAARVLNPAGDTFQEKMRCSLSTAVSRHTMQNRPELVAGIIQGVSANPQPPFAYRNQAIAGATFNGEEQLPRLTGPVLVMAGSEDEVVPPINARLIGDRLPQAQVKTVNGGGHLFFMERPAEANHAVLEFLAGQSAIWAGASLQRRRSD